MAQVHDPRRRTLLKTLGATALASAAWPGLSGCAEAAGQRVLVFEGFDDALRELDRLSQVPRLRSTTVWSWPRTLVHCAQSIEFSLHGFPQPKPALFQATVGAAAFNIFSWRGRMKHDLSEGIPGAPPIDDGVDPAHGYARLLGAIEEFRLSREPLAPHFAYGTLTKTEYERAHVMHLADHFAAFEAVA